MISVILFCIFAGMILWAHYRQALRVSRILDDKKKSDEEALQMRVAVTSARDGILIQDMRARIIWANPSFCDMFGYTLDELIGRNPLAFLIPEDQKQSDEDIEAFRYDFDTGFLDEYEIVQNVRKNGELCWNALSFAHHRTESGQDRIVVTCRDITEQVQQEEELKRSHELIASQAERDELTGVANRVRLRKVLGEIHDKTDAGGTGYGLLHIDLDKFKTINDTHGHAAGDAVLIEATRRIQREIRESDLLCRIGGDEFVIVCPGAEDFETLRPIGERIIENLAQPVIWEDTELQFGGSIGAALSGEGISSSDIIKNADVALYQVKRTGRGDFACYDAELDRTHRARSELSRDLIKAVDRDEFIVHLQPQYSLLANTITGFEALVRWQHPERGELTPNNFIDVATEIGVVKDIDRISAVRGMEALRQIQDAGFDGLEISINAAAPTIIQGDFTEHLKWEADRLKLSPEKIIVEVLETTFFSNTEDAAEATIRKLSKAGFRVELDDFGTGYAGLSHLNRLRVDGVKIDQSMIANLSENISSQTIVNATVGLCRDLGLHVIAEGVETYEQIELLREFGCANVQGYVISRPMPLDGAIEWLANTNLEALGRRQTPQKNYA